MLFYLQQRMEKLLTIKQVAEILRCTETHVWNLLRRGNLPYIKHGRKFTRVRETDLKEYIEKHLVRKGGTQSEQLRKDDTGSHS
jgi:excisionase family DNA binding protein